MKFLKKEYYGFYVLKFNIGKFEFRWFIDCGEWFIYLEWERKDKCISHRFTKEGHIRLDYKKRKVSTN